MRLPLSPTLLLALFAPLLAPSLTAQTRSDTKENSRAGETASDLAPADRRFITRSTRLAMEAIRLSRLAAARATDPGIRALARTIADTREASSSSLLRLAASKEVVLPLDDDPNLTRWLEKQGAEFDHDYLDEMNDALHDTRELLQDRIDEPHDPDIARFAREQLPFAQEHLRRTEELLRQRQSS